MNDLPEILKPFGCRLTDKWDQSAFALNASYYWSEELRMYFTQHDSLNDTSLKSEELWVVFSTEIRPPLYRKVLFYYIVTAEFLKDPQAAKTFLIDRRNNTQ